MSETAIEKVTPGVSALVEVYAEDPHALPGTSTGRSGFATPSQPFAGYDLRGGEQHARRDAS